jgi:hypothetical protein
MSCNVFIACVNALAAEWPAETNLLGSGRIRLKDQNEVIQDVVTASFPFLHAWLVTEHAFPDTLLLSTFTMRSLLAASSHNLKATPIRHRILNDHVYLAKMATLVC